MRLAAGLCALMLACGVALAQPAEPAGSLTAERARIAAERKRIDERVAQEQRVCHQRFAVNSCLETTRLWQRDALDDLRRQEILLNDGERTRKSAEQLERLDDKLEQRRQDQVERERAAAPSSAPASDTRRAPRPASGRVPEAVAPQAPDGNRVDKRQEESHQEDMRRKQERHAQALQRRAEEAARAPEVADQQAQRLREAAEHKARILKRNADQPSKAAPLPPPT